jgi:microcystin-dependent protein
MSGTLQVGGVTLATHTESPSTLTLDSGVVFENAVQPGTVLPYAGELVLIAGTPAPSAPTGYLFCDGSAVSRSTYASLFSAISTNWGSGDGSTTFNIPDLRGEFLRGLDTTEGNDPDYATRTLGSSQAATSFRDGVDGAGGFLTQNSDGSASAGNVNGPNNYANITGRNYQSVRPRNKAINYIIKI